MGSLGGTKGKDGLSRTKVAVEDSHATNAASLRNTFAKSAKLEAFDVLDTLGARPPRAGPIAAAQSATRAARARAQTRRAAVLTRRCPRAARTSTASASQGRAHSGGYGCAGTRTRATTTRSR